MNMSMRSCLANSASLALGSLVGGAAIALSLQSPVQAQAAYGSYVGAGAGIGFGDDSNLSLVLTGRYNVLELPISIRGTAFIGDGSAFVPTVSYDFPLNFNTEVYLGAGISLVNDGSPVGDETAFVLQPGVDYTLSESNLVIFGNAIFAIGGESGGGTATSVQGGVGVQF
ncbi:MAG: hypothetical protein WBB01_20640 [Phormidesmis sp.]